MLNAYRDRTCGYAELLQDRQRYNLLDRAALGELLGLPCPSDLQTQRRRWIEEAMRNGLSEREPCWSEALAVGGEEFIQTIKIGLRSRGRNRKVAAVDQRYVLRDPETAYGIYPAK